MQSIFSNNQYRPVACGLFVLLISACDVRNELKEMHQNTKKMEAHTSKMVEITEKMEQTTSKVNQSVEATNKEMVDTKGNITKMVDKMDHLSATTDELKTKITEVKDVADVKMSGLQEGFDQTYDGLRQGDSSVARREAMRELLNVKSHEKKLAEAGLYFAAFEFQLFNGIGLDKMGNRREKLVLGAAEQFFKDIYEVYNYEEVVNPFADPDLGDAANREASFNAMAAALHKDNPKQEEALFQLKESKGDLEIIHFLKIIKEALSLKKDLSEGKLKLEEMSPIHKQVLANEDVATKLLQARWSFLLVSALDKNVQFKKGGGIYKYLVSGWKLMTKWDLDFSKLNKVELAEQHLYLKKSYETREFLHQLGITTKNYFLTKFFIDRMNPTKMETLDEESQVLAKEILDYLEKLKD